MGVVSSVEDIILFVAALKSRMVLVGELVGVGTQVARMQEEM